MTAGCYARLVVEPLIGAASVIIGSGRSPMTSSKEMKQAAQAWVDQAIACGANPRMILEHPSKRLSVHTAVEGVDWTTHPGRLPDHLIDDVFDILNSMGRVEDLKPASEGDGPP
jgi:hypothetical protein